MTQVKDWRELTLREKIGQTVILLSHTDKHIEKCGSIERFLERYPIGGLHCSGSEVKGFHMEANTSFPALLSEYNKHLRVPLFGVADNGFFASKNGINAPVQMALGAADDEELAFRVGEFRAEDAKHSGLHWCFWPNADMTFTREDPVTSTRATGDDPELVYRMIKKQCEGMLSRGVIPCLKHFPGFVSDSYIDSHLAPHSSEITAEEWEATYGALYRKLFALDFPSIMVAHSAIPALQNDAEDGVYPTATLSYDLTTTLLRQKLGFRGVTVTDALIMGGFSGENAVENTIRSFLAGNDVLLWPRVEYIDEMEKRILAGEIDTRRLDEAVERIWRLKAEFGVLDGHVNSSREPVEFFLNIAKEAAAKGLTLVSDDRGLFPLDRERIKSVKIVGVTPDDKEYETLTALCDEFEKRGIRATIRRNGWVTSLEPELEQNDLMLFALSRNVHRPIGPLDFWGGEATTIWSSNSLPRGKVAVISFGTPYLYKYYHESRLPYINAYGCSAEAVKAVVAAMLGEAPFTGKTPLKRIY